MNFRLLFLTLPLPSALQPPPNRVRGFSLAQRTPQFSSLPVPAVANHVPHATTAAAPANLLEADQQAAVPIDNADLVPIEVKPIDPPPEDDDEVPVSRGLWAMEAVGYLFGIAVFAFLVKLYFSAADLTVLPYRSATQSGIGAISCHFGVPMVVTDVGGLRETVADKGLGMVCPECSPESVAGAVRTYFGEPSLKERFASCIREENIRLSWNRFCKELVGFIESIKK